VLIIGSLKADLQKAQDDRLEKVLSKQLSLREMINELSTASVQKRLLAKARRTPIKTFNYNEMTKVCRLAFDAIKENTIELEDIYTNIDDFNNLENLTNIFVPMGNAIIGHKTVKDYCNDYISTDEKLNLRDDYGDMKDKVEKIFDSMDDDSGVWVNMVKDVGRKHGIFEEKGKIPSVLYNIENVDIRYPELAAIAKEINLFQVENPDKAIMNFKGIKTAAFKTFLKEQKLKRAK